MAENENRVSAVQEAPDSPQEPAALDTPPSEMPVYEPARPVRRVGTLTMGLALVVVGAALCVGLFFPNVDFLLLFKLSPLVLVALGCEVIFAASTAKGMRLKYDFLSMFVCFLLIVTALGAACVPVALQYAGPGRSAAEQRVEQELYEATYARLKGNGDIVNVTYDVHLGELRTPEDVTGAADLKAGDYVGVSAELKGTWATREEFVAACRPVIEAVRATGVRDPYISLYMRESRDTETPLYSLAVEGSYQADMTAEQLAQCVTERIYVDDAGYYMDAEELAGRANRAALPVTPSLRRWRPSGRPAWMKPKLPRSKPVRKRRNALHRYRPKPTSALRRHRPTRTAAWPRRRQTPQRKRVYYIENSPPHSFGVRRVSDC